MARGAIGCSGPAGTWVDGGLESSGLVWHKHRPSTQRALQPCICSLAARVALVDDLGRVVVVHAHGAVDVGRCRWAVHSGCWCAAPCFQNFRLLVALQRLQPTALSLSPHSTGPHSTGASPVMRLQQVKAAMATSRKWIRQAVLHTRATMAACMAALTALLARHVSDLHVHVLVAHLQPKRTGGMGWAGGGA